MASRFGDEEVVEEVSRFGDAPAIEADEPSATLPEEGSLPVAPDAETPGQYDDLLQKLVSGDIGKSQMSALNELSKRGKLQERFGEAFSVAALSSGKIEGQPKPVEQAGVPIGEALQQGLKNLPASAANQIKSLWEAVTSPAKTWEGVKALSKDIYKNQMEVALTDMGFDPAKVKFEEGAMLEHIEQTPALDTVIDKYKEDYGSYEGFKNAIATDPAMVITDIATLLTPTARVVEGAAIAAKLPAVAKVAETVAKGAALTEPITAAGTAAKQTAKVVSKLTGEMFGSLTPAGLYKSAVKMTTKLSDAERTRLANVALESGIMPTIKGIDKIDDNIGKIDSKIAGMIDKANDTGKKMPLGKLFKDFKKLKEDRLLSTKAKEGVRAINRVRQSMLEANAKIGRGRLTPKEVQTLKKTIYGDLKGAYENMKNSTASIKAQKAVARSAKEYLEAILPEIKQLNKTDGDLIKLREAIRGPASRITNHQLMNLNLVSKAGTGAVAGGMIGGPELAALLTTVGVGLSALDNPIVKSKLAIVLDKLQKQGVVISPDRAVKILLAEEALASVPTEEQEREND